MLRTFTIPEITELVESVDLCPGELLIRIDTQTRVDTLKIVFLQTTQLDPRRIHAPLRNSHQERNCIAGSSQGVGAGGACEVILVLR